MLLLGLPSTVRPGVVCILEYVSVFWAPELVQSVVVYLVPGRRVVRTLVLLLVGLRYSLLPNPASSSDLLHRPCLRLTQIGGQLR